MIQRGRFAGELLYKSSCLNILLVRDRTTLKDPIMRNHDVAFIIQKPRDGEFEIQANWGVLR
jgi:hypothetical protein